MKGLLSLGAINKDTGEYVHTKIANKKDKYICPECNKDLILCQGKIKAHHFRHKVDSINPCRYYSNPSETQIHKDAKMLLQSLLENKVQITFVRQCCSCKEDEEIEIEEIGEGSSIQLEYRFEYNGIKIADVAYIDDGEILCIFEICNTHRTSSENRPEPWFEIDAITMIKLAKNNSSTSLKIPCIRCEKCEQCIEKRRKEQELKKSNIREIVTSKSSYNCADSYPCFSNIIMEVIVSIICGDNLYEKLCIIDKEINNDNNLNLCKFDYQEDLIQNIQNMHLHKYLHKLYVDKGSLYFTFEISTIPADIIVGIHKNIPILCEHLFGEFEDFCGSNDCKIMWKYDNSHNKSVFNKKSTRPRWNCHDCGDSGSFQGEPCYMCFLP